MLDKIFSRQSRIDHPDPTQRLLGVAELAPDSDDLQRVLKSDPVPSVRAAAARQSTHVEALAAALDSESDADVRGALLETLAATADPERLTSVLSSDRVQDAERASVARRAAASPQRMAAISAMQGEDTLLDLALTADTCISQWRNKSRPRNLIAAVAK